MVDIILNAELIDASTMTDSFCNCKVDYKLFVAIDYLPNVVAVGCHLVRQSQFLINQDVMMQFSKLFLLKDAKLPPMLSLHKTI